MKNLLVVMLLLLIGVLIYIDILQPIHTQRNNYNEELNHYANGITA